MLINERRGDGELSSKRKWWHLKGAEAGGAADHTLMDETTRRNANNETSSDHTVGVIDWLLFFCLSRLSHAKQGRRKRKRRRRKRGCCY